MNKYFKILLLIFGLTCSMNGYAQLKDGILFQAVARDASGNAASNRDIYVKIFVLKATSTGEVVYAETFQVRSTDEGVFSIVIGNGTRIAGVSSLSLIDWRTSIYFLNLKIAIAPTLPTPGWNYENEYVDQGTAQFWSVPYSLFSNRSITADSAFTITTLLPGSKGGTGVINEGKTITLDGNLKIAGTGNVTLTNKGNTNITLPLSGKLVTDISFDTLQNKILTSPKLIGNPIAVTPDISSKDSSIATTGFVATLLGLDKTLLNSKIDSIAAAASSNNEEKLNITDTASMLSLRFARDTASLSNRINLKLNLSDTSIMLANRFARDTASLSKRIDKLSASSGELSTGKLNISDTSIMLSNRFNRDTISLSNRINSKLGIAQFESEISKYLDSVQVLKLNDTAAMLSNRFARDTVSLSNRINTNKQAIIDTASALNIRKVNVSDTSAMLTSRFARDTVSLSTRINTNKQAIIDSASALDIRKVNVSDTSAMLTSRFARDTVSLSNRINTNKQAIIDSASTLNTRINTNKQAIIDTASALNIRKVNVSDTSAMLTSRFARDTVSLSTRINTNKQAIVDSASALNTRINTNKQAIIDSASALNIRKVNVSDTAAMLTSRFARDTVSLSNRINTNKQAIIDSASALNIRKVNVSDTSAMLSSRFARDTVSLSSRINTNKQAIIDSASALNIRKVNVSDTSAMLTSRFARDTVSLSNRINQLSSTTSSGKVSVTDTATMLTNYARKLTSNINVKLSTGKYLGKYTNGDVIPAAGKTLDELMFDIATETIHPTYVSPTVSISSSPTSGDYEIGSTITPITLSNTFVKNDGGNSTSITYQKNNSNIGSNVDGITNMTTTQTFRVVVNYGIGAVKNNNLNVADSVGIITAGSVTSGLISFVPRAKKYWGTSDASTITDADILANSNEFASAKAKSSFSINVSSGTKYIYYAYPASYGTISDISVGGFTSTSAFTLVTRNVTNAQGYTQSYHIYISNNNFSETVNNIIFN